MHRPADSPPADSKPAEPKVPDPLANLVKSTGAPAVAPSNTAQAAGQRRVAAVQRALTEYGYGQLKPTGTVGSDTQAAIQKFERQRKIPVPGQVSDRLVPDTAPAPAR